MPKHWNIQFSFSTKKLPRNLVRARLHFFHPRYPQDPQISPRSPDIPWLAYGILKLCGAYNMWGWGRLSNTTWWLSYRFRKFWIKKILDQWNLNCDPCLISVDIFLKHMFNFTFGLIEQCFVLGTSVKWYVGGGYPKSSPPFFPKKSLRPHVDGPRPWNWKRRKDEQIVNDFLLLALTGKYNICKWRSFLLLRFNIFMSIYMKLVRK